MMWGHESIERVSVYKSAGVWFSSRPGISLQSIMIKRLQKHAGWQCQFCLGCFVGSLAPTDRKLLYMARVNPILTFASEIVLDLGC